MKQLLLITLSVLLYAQGAQAQAYSYDQVLQIQGREPDLKSTSAVMYQMAENFEVWYHFESGLTTSTQYITTGLNYSSAAAKFDKNKTEFIKTFGKPDKFGDNWASWYNYNGSVKLAIKFAQVNGGYVYIQQL